MEKKSITDVNLGLPYNIFPKNRTFLFKKIDFIFFKFPAAIKLKLLRK